MDDSRRKLIWHGMFLFLLGLLTGFVETKFANPRMGLAAHLEGVMNGTFLIALGAIWTEMQESSVIEPIAFWTTLYGTYMNWAITTFAAVITPSQDPYSLFFMAVPMYVFYEASIVIGRILKK